jgi:hypothetical protein
MKNQSRKPGKFQNSEFSFQASWNAYGEQGTTPAHEP